MYFQGVLFYGDDKYWWNGLDYSKVTVECYSHRSRITLLPSRFNASCSYNLFGSLLQLCLVLIHLVTLVTFRCDFELLLFEVEVWFVGSGESLYQCRLWHGTWTMKRHTPKSLHKCFDWLSFLLLCSKKSWHVYFDVIFKESCQEKLLEVNPFLDRANRKLHEPLKGNPLEGADE